VESDRRPHEGTSLTSFTVAKISWGKKVLKGAGRRLEEKGRGPDPCRGAADAEACLETAREGKPACRLEKTSSMVKRIKLGGGGDGLECIRTIPSLTRYRKKKGGGDKGDVEFVGGVRFPDSESTAVSENHGF